MTVVRLKVILHYCLRLDVGRTLANRNCCACSDAFRLNEPRSLPVDHSRTLTGNLACDISSPGNFLPGMVSTCTPQDRRGTVGVVSSLPLRFPRTLFLDQRRTRTRIIVISRVDSRVPIGSWFLKKSRWPMLACLSRGSLVAPARALTQRPNGRSPGALSPSNRGERAAHN
jgi:hypothetical protein